MTDTTEPTLFIVPKIHAAMVKVMRAVDYIGKDRRAGSSEERGPRYNFRGIDDVYNVLHGPMAEAGVFVLPNIRDRVCVERETKSGGAMFYVTLTATFRFVADDGSFVECTTIGESMDSSDKATNKAMSVALKYALMQVLLIPTQEDKDPENAHHEVKAKAKTMDDWKAEVRNEGKLNGCVTAEDFIARFQDVLQKDRPENPEDCQKMIAHFRARREGKA